MHSRPEVSTSFSPRLVVIFCAGDKCTTRATPGFAAPVLLLPGLDPVDAAFGGLGWRIPPVGLVTLVGGS